MRKIVLNFFPIVLLSLVLSFPIIFPYFHKGYFPTHDGEWAVVRLSDMFRELRDYQFPARYSGNLNFGYGYPLFNFTYPFPYYLGVILHFFKLSFVDSIKFLFAVSVPVSIFFMFLASSEFWENKLAGFISSILYAYFPYRMVDLFVRGSIGESISLFLFPLIFFLMTKLQKKNEVLIWGTAAIFYAILIMTHNIMAVFFSLILFGLTVFFFLFEGKKNIKFYLIFFVFALLISSFFWFPALFEKSFIRLSQIPIADRNLYFVNFKQLLFSSWGYGTPTDSNGFTYQLGLPHVILYVFTLIFVVVNFLKRKSKDNYLKRAFFVGLLILPAIFLLFKDSAFFWKLPFLSEINYPWTLLAPLGFLISLLAGFLCRQRGAIKYVVLLISISSIIMFLPYARPQSYFDKGDSYYFTNDATTTSSDELMPLWVKDLPKQRVSEKIEAVNGKFSFSNLTYSSKNISFDVNAFTESKVRVNTIYYPGWKAFINGKESLIDYSNRKGVMEVQLEKGENDVYLVFLNTPIRSTGNFLSLISLLILIILFLKHFYYRYIGISVVNKK